MHQINDRWIFVELPNGGAGLVPVQCYPDPARVVIGPLPPDVAEFYEVRVIAAPFLVPKAAAAASVDAAAPEAAPPPHSGSADTRPQGS